MKAEIKKLKEDFESGKTLTAEQLNTLEAELKKEEQTSNIKNLLSKKDEGAEDNGEGDNAENNEGDSNDEGSNEGENNEDAGNNEDGNEDTNEEGEGDKGLAGARVQRAKRIEKIPLSRDTKEIVNAINNIKESRVGLSSDNTNGFDMDKANEEFNKALQNGLKGSVNINGVKVDKPAVGEDVDMQKHLSKRFGQKDIRFTTSSGNTAFGNNVLAEIVAVTFKDLGNEYALSSEFKQRAIPGFQLQSDQLARINSGTYVEGTDISNTDHSTGKTSDSVTLDRRFIKVTLSAESLVTPGDLIQEVRTGIAEERSRTADASCLETILADTDIETYNAGASTTLNGVTPEMVQKASAQAKGRRKRIVMNPQSYEHLIGNSISTSNRTPIFQNTIRPNALGTETLLGKDVVYSDAMADPDVLNGAGTTEANETAMLIGDFNRAGYYLVHQNIRFATEYVLREDSYDVAIFWSDGCLINNPEFISKLRVRHA